MIKKQFVVIGLGRFGSTICKELFLQGHEVLAIDQLPENIHKVSKYASHVVVADAIDEDALNSLGLRNFDHAIIAIGEKIQPSILCTLILKEMGIKKVWVKAQNEQHEKVLEKIGADRVIHPEKEMGIRIANQLNSERIIDYIELSKEYSIIELVASNKVSSQTIENLDIRAKYGCTLLAIKNGEDINISPSSKDTIYEGDILIVMGQNNDLKRFEVQGL
ncbi:potassium channel family protein [Gracilibacillus kekensis]|uniref:Trk system potassium uptake protein TrkA n=1 Tax=Gracilibacillus kekensis TaxID=1027249 RepID=A0A1M7KHV4_9BACI|nr:TrkA family potassium uptake protein [Gracilibacillus kekensis]SHM64893.1 trk system potassium uptake protein TrkA [Gracilibacillus kekensis]